MSLGCSDLGSRHRYDDVADRTMCARRSGCHIQRGAWRSWRGAKLNRKFDLASSGGVMIVLDFADDRSVRCDRQRKRPWAADAS